MRPKKKQQIKDTHRSAPMPTPAGRAVVVEKQTSFLVEQIRMLTTEIKHIEEHLQQLTTQHPDVHIHFNETLPLSTSPIILKLDQNFNNIPAGSTFRAAKNLKNPNI